ncbi:MAG: flagellar hook-length control protein FliK [Methylophilus sp.]|nr:flagellar hook-length control protein FliK [Methylophilus sp.]
MILSNTEATANQVNSVYKIMPVLAVGQIGSTAQELEAKTAQLVKGLEYVGQITAKVNDTTFLVKVSGQQVQDLVLKMELGKQAQLGETLSLKYLDASPIPTFLLKETQPTTLGAQVKLSHTGHLLGQYLQQAEAQGTPRRFEATAVVTHFPYQPQLVAQDLKQAVASTGLFYESHLQELMHGKYPLNQIKQEPQNQTGFSHEPLLYQQLAVLENQRLSWHGEVWPGQKMTWDIYQQRLPEHAQQSRESVVEQSSAPIASELTIDFPNLGKVTAKLSLINGRMRINIESNTSSTFQLLHKEKLKLSEAIHHNGQQLDALTVSFDATS